MVEVHERHRFFPDNGCYDFSVFNDLITIRDALNGRVKDSLFRGELERARLRYACMDT